MKRGWRDWPWASKLALLLVAGAVVPLTAVTLYNAATARRELLAATRSQSLSQARGTAEALDAYLDRSLADVRVVAAAPQTLRLLADAAGSGGTAGTAATAGTAGEIAPPVPPELAADVGAALGQMRETHGFEALYLTGPEGDVRLATDPRLAGRNYVSARYFLTAMAGESAVDEPRWDAEDGRIHLHLSAPVRQLDGPILGVAIGRIDLSGLDAIVAGDTDFAGRGEVGLLWDSDGLRLSEPARTGLRFHPLSPLLPNVAETLTAEARFGPGTGRFLSPAPVPGLFERSRWLLYDKSADPHLRSRAPGLGPVEAVAVPLLSKRWLYGILTPEAGILAAQRAQARRNLLFALLTALFAAAVAVAAARWAARPLRRVGQAANAIAAGDLTRRAGFGSPDQGDEIGRLAAAFDAMADSLAKKDAELRGYAEHLEQRVAEGIAAEREARKRAEEANRVKDEFLSTVSHELRTPLHAILGWTFLLGQGQLDPAATRRAIATIERNAKAQGQIVDDLLDVSRIITGKLLLKVERVELAPIVQAALDAARPAAEAKEIRLAARLDPQAVVQGDPNRLQQVVWNLLSNAVKFTPRKGWVEVRLDRAGAPSEIAGIAEFAEIAVADDGIGIPAEFLDLVFERFRQVDSSTTREHGGLGLGLAIVKHLVELHGGTVTAASPGPGRGSTFTVRLPVAPEEPAALTKPAAQTRESPPA